MTDWPVITKEHLATLIGIDTADPNRAAAELFIHKADIWQYVWLLIQHQGVLAPSGSKERLANELIFKRGHRWSFRTTE